MAEVQAAAAPGSVVDPLRAFRFHVEVQGVGEGHFTSVSGMGVQVEAIKYREGGANVTPRFVPGQVDYAEITLCYGLTQSDRMWDWLMAAAAGNVDRREVSIVMREPDGTRGVLRWNLTRAWPTKWVGAQLDAMSKALALECMSLVYEGIERDATSAPEDGGPAGAPGE
jgi:phage tail-like protein